MARLKFDTASLHWPMRRHNPWHLNHSRIPISVQDFTIKLNVREHLDQRQRHSLQLILRQQPYGLTVVDSSRNKKTVSHSFCCYRCS